LIRIAYTLREWFGKEIMLVQAHFADLKSYAANGPKRELPPDCPLQKLCYSMSQPMGYRHFRDFTFDPI
jgi:hypothetical protein